MTMVKVLACDVSSWYIGVYVKCMKCQELNGYRLRRLTDYYDNFYAAWKSQPNRMCARVCLCVLNGKKSQQMNTHQNATNERKKTERKEEKK